MKLSRPDWETQRRTAAPGEVCPVNPDQAAELDTTVVIHVDKLFI